MTVAEQFIYGMCGRFVVIFYIHLLYKGSLIETVCFVYKQLGMLDTGLFRLWAYTFFD